MPQRPTHAVLSDSQQSTLRGALVCAAERFDEYVKQFEAAKLAFDVLGDAEKEAYLNPPQTDPGALIINPHPNFYVQMAETFRQQAQDVRDVLALVDGEDDASLVTIRVTNHFD